MSSSNANYTARIARQVLFAFAAWCCSMSADLLWGADSANEKAKVKRPPAASSDKTSRTSPASIDRLATGAAPKSVVELRELEARVRVISEVVMASTVSVAVSGRHGSGVVVSSDGYVLTAAHVIEETDRTAVVTFPDGRRVMARTLGIFRTEDAGLLKITEKNSRSSKGDWPSRDFAANQSVQPGHWCLALGHPNGFQSDRRPVVRLGRVLAVSEKHGITTDCTLVGGDSGGPLFNLDGQVIGVHSRIGGSLAVNLHVPIEAFSDNWERLKTSEVWGNFPGTEPFIGVRGDRKSSTALVTEVFSGTPADQCGIKVGDVITKFDGDLIGSFDTLSAAVSRRKAGDKVTVQILRDEKLIELELTIGRRET